MRSIHKTVIRFTRRRYSIQKNAFNSLKVVIQENAFNSQKLFIITHAKVQKMTSFICLALTACIFCTFSVPLRAFVRSLTQKTCFYTQTSVRYRPLSWVVKAKVYCRLNGTPKHHSVD